jgi:hypothetical protein
MVITLYSASHAADWPEIKMLRLSRSRLASQARLSVGDDYALRERGLARWLGRLFGRYYARWCTRQMVDDAMQYFTSGR